MRNRGPTLVFPEAGLAINLIRADIDEPADSPGLAAGLQEHVRPVGVVHGEGQAVTKRVINMGLQRERSIQGRQFKC